ncbi:MAG TPA: hypothetical protein VFK96_10630 [Gammaproteobacteria bacterium]|nr:hypothetical protein [Gammaproteobacteria bacterium]
MGAIVLMVRAVRIRASIIDRTVIKHRAAKAAAANIITTVATSIAVPTQVIPLTPFVVALLWT